MNYSKPIIIAHRGDSQNAPENTMAAFRLAKRSGAEGIELDVHLSADGELVVLHDYEINRTGRNADGSELKEKTEVKDLTLKELRKYDFGIWLSEKYAGEKIPTLKQVMDLIGPETVLDIEIKADMNHSYKEPSVALAKFLYEYSKNISIENVFVSSFHPFALNTFKITACKLNMNIPTSLIYYKGMNIPWYMKIAQIYAIYKSDILKIYYKDLTSKKHLRGSGFLKKKPIMAWTVDEPDIAKELMNKHISGIITNAPSIIKKSDISR